ncbi:hypothetical protein MASR1M12_10760 [Erysipelotrichia bacterium]
MLESMGECPPVDEAFYYGFCGGGKKKPQAQNVGLVGKDARKEFLESLSSKGRESG